MRLAVYVFFIPHRVYGSKHCDFITDDAMHDMFFMDFGVRADDERFRQRGGAKGPHISNKKPRHWFAYQYGPYDGAPARMLCFMMLLATIWLLLQYYCKSERRFQQLRRSIYHVFCGSTSSSCGGGG